MFETVKGCQFAPHTMRKTAELLCLAYSSFLEEARPSSCDLRLPETTEARQHRRRARQTAVCSGRGQARAEEEEASKQHAQPGFGSGREERSRLDGDTSKSGTGAAINPKFAYVEWACRRWASGLGCSSDDVLSGSELCDAVHNCARQVLALVTAKRRGAQAGRRTELGRKKHRERKR